MVFSKLGRFFSRQKKTTIETLELIDKEIKDFEKFKQKSESNEKKYVGALLLYGIVLYIMGALFYYIYLMPKKLGERMKTLIPFLIMPFLIYFIRRLLKWFYIKRHTYCEKRLNELKEEKKNILEDVKENETYKKAREILERFSTGVDIQITPPTSPLNNKTIFPNDSPQTIDSKNRKMNETMMMNQSTLNPNNLNATQIIHRNVKQIQQQNQSMIMSQKPSGILNNTNTNANFQTGSTSETISHSNVSLPRQVSPLAMNQPRGTLPRPIIAPNRTIFDKVLDFLIGEGPNNRYALICKNCHFHNGMALAEEFEFIAFRCAYCLFYNEARKNKLTVPNQKSNTNTARADKNLNESNTSTSNLSSMASFDEDTKEEAISNKDALIDPVSEPLISASSLSSNFKNSMKSASVKSLNNLNSNSEETMRRKSSLTDTSNLLRNRVENMRASRSSLSRSDEKLFSKDENKENQTENMDFELVQNSKKNE